MEAQKFSDFSKDLRRVHDPRHHEIKHSYGVRDAFCFYRKHKPEGHKYVLQDVEYYKIIRAVNKKLCDILRNAGTVTLPCNMGELYATKYPTRVVYEGKTLVNTHPVDWISTLKLWYEDPEAKSNKILVRKLDKELIKLIYRKSSARFKNKSFFGMEFNRELKKSINQCIKDEKFDIYNSYKSCRHNI